MWMVQSRLISADSAHPYKSQRMSDLRVMLPGNDVATRARVDFERIDDEIVGVAKQTNRAVCWFVPQGRRQLSTARKVSDFVTIITPTCRIDLLGVCTRYGDVYTFYAGEARVRSLFAKGAQ